MGLEQYIISVLDEPQVKVTLVEGVYHVNSEIDSTKVTSIDTLAFKQMHMTERIRNKLKTYLPSDVECTVFVHVKPNFAKLSKSRHERPR
jgi:hypothetical protein